MKRDAALHGVKDQVLKAPAYTLRTYDAKVKLNQNENPYDFPEDLKQETFRRFMARRWSRYPEFVPDSLRAQLAGYCGWEKEGILVGNGSNELLLAALLVLVREGTPVVIPSPSFQLYCLVSQILCARITAVPLKPDMGYDVDALLAAADEVSARVLILCSPNNPTGTELAQEDLGRILENFGGHVLLDEAYYEFSGRTGLQFMKRFPRLIVTRTFSKAMGMAGLRLGYLMANPGLASQIAKAKLPYNVNQFSLTAAQVALENLDRYRPAIESILKERDRLRMLLSGIPGVKVFPTGANFFLFELPVPPRGVFEELYRQGILIRDVSSYPMLSRCLRVTVGTPEENDLFIAALRRTLEPQQAAMP
ncbi:MAG: histidinol-phosphate transaminase [Acidobacteria bacterium]|nr:histidinol-phosphate transaminase [Acidobacteriota bacterium]